MDYLKTGLLALENDDCQEAVNIFRRALDTKPSASAYNGLGKAFSRLGDHEAARWAFSKGLELDGSDNAPLSQAASTDRIIHPAASISKQRRFRAVDRYLEVFDGKWRRLFFKGVNIGLGLPGYFPGEYAIHEATYLKWFRQIIELGANSVRLYTIHPPGFYDALAQVNNSGKQLFLFQGIWCELPEKNDFRNPDYLDSVRRSIIQAVDVIHGAAELPEAPGMPHGRYRSDVSSSTAAFIFGREWEPCAVKGYNLANRSEAADYKGACLSAHDCTPFERWITETCDHLQKYELDRYGQARPVSVANWPTLDPLAHPAESSHEEELVFQGTMVRADICNENEDMEALDVKKIKSHQGGGFFATYHVYPYYPDFMNNEFADAGNPYLEYLSRLKKHHASQPVLIAEFGVPSSREITHWQLNGWHHGGHNERAQGEICGKQMKTIHQAGLAGGMMFSWFDEWFKRNWLFLPYELPALRKPLWFNLQDAEQNFGLLATYPGYPVRAVSLSARSDEWKRAAVVCEKGAERMIHRFNDGHDNKRRLRRLQATSDEGFLYLRLEIAGPVDFEQAHYLIGIDTCSPEVGETLLPFNTRLHSPVGLKFLLQLSGRDTSRILVCKSYDRYLNRETNLIRPVNSDQGEWVTMQNRTNARRISKDKRRFYPARVADTSRLRFGSLDSKNGAYDSLADFYFSGNAIEIRLPWGLINFTDPSSRTVLWLDKNGTTRESDGIRFVAASFKPVPNMPYAQQTGKPANISDCLPENLSSGKISTYSWDKWNVPLFHTYCKASYYVYRDVLNSIPEVI